MEIAAGNGTPRLHLPGPDLVVKLGSPIAADDDDELRSEVPAGVCEHDAAPNRTTWVSAALCRLRRNLSTNSSTRGRQDGRVRAAARRDD